ncbi:hypothetical protein IHE51_00040, partial [Candidatus Parvarchaeota archaeon]|nr:hypothetical protein [Candidatus Acidifodinimicrobium mancum]
MAVNMRNKGQSAAIFTLIIAILVSTALVVLLYMTNPGIFGNLAYLLTLIKAAPAVSPSQAIFTAYNCINTPCTPFGSSYSSDMWTLYYGGSTQTQALNSQISFTVYNGTYTLAAQAINLGKQLFLCPETSNSGVYYNYSVPSGNSYKIYFYPCQLETTTFTETGLPSGQKWNMTYDGVFELSTSNSLIFKVPIAKYAFSINKSNGYEPNPASGALQSGQTQSITFTPTIVYVTTTFYSGLSQYASYYSGNWTLVYDGVTGTNTSLAKPIHILTSNDQSQSYPVTAYINNYVCNAKTSSVTTGSTYTFSNWNCITLFSESGLPIDKNWNLTYNGVFNGSTKSTIPINTSAGYYKFKYFIPQNIPTSNQQQTYYVPITITNSQGSATPSPFQQEVVVDSADYQNYEASNLQNVEFLYSNGQIIPSWLESGASSSSTQTIYWLKLASSIPAGSSITIYMEFAPKTTNLFNGNTIGEAPQLSPTYGEYDDGVDVFNGYWNFAGTSLPPGLTSIVDGGSLTVNDGITLTAENSGQYVIVYSSSVLPDPTVVDAWLTAGVSSYGIQLGETTGSGVYSGFGTPYYTYEYATEHTQIYYINDGSDDYYPSSGTGGYAVPEVASFVWSSTTDEAQAMLNYANEILWNNANYAPPPTYYLTVFVSGSWVAGSGEITWLRERASPPNGVMPSVSFGGVQTLQQAISTPPCYYSTSSTATNNETEAGSSANIIYYQEYCPVLFYQNTLPQGTDWSVTMNGNTETWTPASGSNGAVENLTFYALNDTVASFTVPAISTSNCKYTPTPSSGSVNVGKQFSQEVSYTSVCQNIEYLPITITNSQGSATPSPFQQEVVVDSADYQNYEASNLQNVEFLYS